MQDTTELSTVAASDANKTFATMISAFIADPLMRWMYPEPHSYVESFPKLVRAFTGSAFEDGTAYAAKDFSGAALWLQPGKTPDEEAAGALIEETVRP